MSGDPPNDLVDRAYQVGAAAVANAAESDPGATADRRGAIFALGIIQIVLGAFTGLMAAAMLVGYAVGSRSVAMTLGAGLVCLAPVVNLLVTGIGSVRIARWARRATLISAGIWLTLMLFAVAFVLGTGGPGMGQGETAMVGVIVVPVLLVTLALPIVLLAVYTRPSVRATFERRTK